MNDINRTRLEYHQFSEETKRVLNNLLSSLNLNAPANIRHILINTFRSSNDIYHKDSAEIQNKRADMLLEFLIYSDFVIKYADDLYSFTPIGKKLKESASFEKYYISIEIENTKEKKRIKWKDAKLRFDANLGPFIVVIGAIISILVFFGIKGCKNQ